jgi:hypothetical protein
MQKKRWGDLSPIQKVLIIIGATIQFGLLAGGLWDLAHRTPDEVRGDRRFWAGFMFVNWIGPIAYFAYGRKNCPIRSCCRQTQELEPLEEVEAV